LEVVEQLYVKSANAVHSLLANSPGHIGWVEYHAERFKDTRGFDIR